MIGRKRVETKPSPPAPPPPPPSQVVEKAESRHSFDAPRPAPRLEETRRFANIGKSIHIKGELTGNEDLTIDGTIEGKIVLTDHNLTIGQNGRITAEVWAKSVVVVGHVLGNIHAQDRIEVKDGGTVEGDLHAPRVVLAEGARFRGSVDMMSGGSAPRQRPRPQPPARPKPAPAAFDEGPETVLEDAMETVGDVFDIVDEATPASESATAGKDPQGQRDGKHAKGDKAGDRDPKASTGSKLAGMFDEFDPANP